MNDFFDVDIIECKPGQATREQWISNRTKVERRPIFIGHLKKNSDTYWTLKLHNISGRSKPLEMTSHLIAKMYGLPTTFGPRLQDMTYLYDSFDINFNFYLLVQDSKRCVAMTSNSLPGTRTGTYRQISIGSKDEKVFWLSSNYPVLKKLYCRIFPGKCSFWESRLNKLERHEKQCTDTTIVSPKKVTNYLHHIFKC